MFASTQHKGQGEWKLFDPVRHDTVGMFRVKTPEKKVPRYGTVVPAKRYEKQYTPRPAH